MKSNLIKKGIAIVLSSLILLTGCSTVGAETNNPENESYKIGISQLIEHPSLDQAREGFVDEMKALGVDVEIDYSNAQGETSSTQLIAEKFVKDKVDLIYSIATLSSQSARRATEGTDIPVVFSSVTDPVYSDIVSEENEIENVTGVSDKVKVGEILSLAKDLKEDASVVGIIYNTGESNSEVQVNEVKAAAETLGMTVETVGIISANDIPQAVNTLAKKIDVMYVIGDNIVANAIGLVANLAIENNIITLSSIESQAADGILIANGLNYYEHGKQAARMAKRIMVDGEDIKDVEIEYPSTVNKIVNLETMKALGLSKDNKAFEGAEFVGE